MLQNYALFAHDIKHNILVKNKLHKLTMQHLIEKK